MDGPNAYDIANEDFWENKASGVPVQTGPLHTRAPSGFDPNRMIVLTIHCDPNKYVQTGTYHFDIQGIGEVSCPVGESVKIYLPKKKGSYAIHGAIEGCDKKVKFSPDYIWTDYGDAERTTVVKAGLGKWVGLVNTK